MPGRAARLLPRFLIPAVIAAGLGFALFGESANDQRRPGNGGGEGNPFVGVSLAGCLQPASDRSPSGPVDTERIERDVQRVRGLRFSRPPRVELLSADELDRRIRREFRREYRPGAVDVERRLLTLVGAIPPGTDLLSLQRGALVGQVVGYYDTRRRRLVATASGDLDLVERITLAHELDHALTDDALGIPLPDRPDPRRSDAFAAREALAEGDATLTMLRYAAATASLADLLDISTDPTLFAEGDQGLEDLPQFLRDSLLFPYTQGSGYVCALYRQGGWGAVDDAYRRPPRTTYEILFPAERGAAPARAPVPGRLPPPWHRRLRTQFGAAPLLFLLQAPGGDRDRGVDGARRLVAAWGGDTAELWIDGERSALGAAFVDRRRGLTMCAAVSGWYALAFPDAARTASAGGRRFEFEGDAQDAVIRCRAGVVRLGIAPRLGDARRLAG